MVTTTLDNTQLKNIFKEALLELLQEQPDLFSGVFTEAMEDIALLKAMEEVDENDLVSRDEIFQILEPNK